MDAFLAGTDTLLLVLQKRIYGQETFAKNRRLTEELIYDTAYGNLLDPISIFLSRKRMQDEMETWSWKGLFCSLVYSKKSPRKTTLEMPRILDAILQAVLSSKQN